MLSLPRPTNKSCLPITSPSAHPVNIAQSVEVAIILAFCDCHFPALLHNFKSENTVRTVSFAYAKRDAPETFYTCKRRPTAIDVATQNPSLLLREKAFNAHLIRGDAVGDKTQSLCFAK